LPAGGPDGYERIMWQAPQLRPIMAWALRRPRRRNTEYAAR
jgi:hypothetical protein